MGLGSFSISLNVKDIKLSKSFYEKIGFKEFVGDITQNWIVMKNESTVIGLFQGMFDKNIMTFNPGWDQSAQKLETFTDVRTLQKEFLDKGIEIKEKVDEKTKGPASFMIVDPDGNQILFDQHV